LPDPVALPEKSRVRLPDLSFEIGLGDPKKLQTKKRKDILSLELVRTKFGPTSAMYRIMVLFQRVEAATFDTTFIEETSKNVHVWMTDAVKMFKALYPGESVPGQSLHSLDY
jgi:hypothetical protein